ncbi:hypothetical protein SAMN05421741_1512 [Paenimyroides ummariense]|uniref:WD40-like Beta Propeller Repeat n=1 Tax=Paenimyroides ummariense TaxID=913024 RepID=A0A1I5GVE1_9FLAO|nr:hypothetical protein [Paenimyroides ummariense]SFO39917.1 hypothetical protein SAMN05421741_1512 [Paenimyroides ummariense]
MKRNIVLTITLLISCILFNCKSDNEDTEHLLTFDIDPSGSHLIFSWKTDNKTSIYRCDIDGENVKKILDNDSLSYYAPRYSKEGDSIIFIATDYPNSLLTSIGVWNVKENSSKLIVNDSLLKTEAVLSEAGNKLIFLGANEYGKYSPIGRKAPHGFDIYELNIKKNVTKRVTNFNAYQMNNLNYIQKDKFTFSSFLDGKDGVFLYNNQTKNISMITVKNDSLKSLNGFSKAEYINDTELVYTSYYKINLVDFRKNTKKKIYRSKSGNHISNLSYSKKLNKLFVSEQKQNLIYVLDLDGKLIKTITINIKAN